MSATRCGGGGGSSSSRRLRRSCWALFLLIMLGSSIHCQVSADGGASTTFSEKGDAGSVDPSSAAANEIRNLKSKLKSLEDIFKEKETSLQEKARRIQYLEKELKNSQAALRRAELKAAKRTRDVAKAYEAWFPSWAAGYIAQLQGFATYQWGAYGEPILRFLQEKNSLPSIREKLVQLSANTGPLLVGVKKKVTDTSNLAKDYVVPRLKRAEEAIGPYIQLIKKKSSPLVDNAVNAFKPYYVWFRKASSPYSRKVHKAYKRSLRFARNYHYQLQRSIKATMSRHEYSAKFANKQVTWFLASAILLLPALILVITFSSHFGKGKISQPTSRSSSSSHTGSSHKRYRRAKQADK